jgi:hypothetical protein
MKVAIGGNTISVAAALGERSIVALEAPSPGRHALRKTWSASHAARPLPRTNAGEERSRAQRARRRELPREAHGRGKKSPPRFARRRSPWRSCSHPHPRVTVLAEMKSENCAARPLPGGEVTTPAPEQQALSPGGEVTTPAPEQQALSQGRGNYDRAGAASTA